jgi:preprotein translocase subunit SecB
MAESTFQFIGYRISKIQCEINDNFNPKDLKISQSIDIQQNYDKEKSQFVEVIMNVSLNDEEGLFNFLITMKGGFLGSEDIPKDIFEKFSTINAPAIMYPYIRSIITNYTAQANIPPIILPTVNFASKIKESKE